MPELPEVEVTRRRLEQHLVGKVFERVVVRTPKLRLPIPPEIGDVLPGQRVRSIGRRGKYLLLVCDRGCLIIHLGMTGFLQVLTEPLPAGRHDHVDFLFASGPVLRFHDPRKFGTVLWTTDDPLAHPLLSSIGPEPLLPGFDGAYLFAVSRSRQIAVKLLVMDSAVVAGVGNIYANEALFRAGIRPTRPAGSLSSDECERLAESIRTVLAESVEQGSTYRVKEELVSYHPFTFHVYGRAGDRCSACGTPLEHARLGNRSSVFCPRCQR